MHEENINYIRQYLKENSQFPMEQLVATLRDSGYHTEDILAAQSPEVEETNVEPVLLDRSLGSENFSQPTVESSPEQKMAVAASVDVLQPKTTSRFSKTSLIWWGAGLVVVMALAAVVYVFVFAHTPASSTDMVEQVVSPAKDPSSMTSSEDQADTKMAKQENMVGDILAPFGKSFYEGDFKAVVRGTDAATPDALKEYTLYTKKGVVVRAEFTSLPNRISIMKNNKVFDIESAKKVFHEYADGTPEAQAISDRAINDIDALDALTEQSFSGDIHWNARAGLVYVNSPDEGAETIRVTLDPTSQMVSEMAVRSSSDAAWHTVAFTFSPSSDIDSLVRFPLDYKKTDAPIGS